MNTLENAIRSDAEKINARIKMIQKRAEEANLANLVERIDGSTSTSANPRDDFKDHFNKSWDKGWANYGKG